MYNRSSFPHRLRMSVSHSGTGMNMSTFSRFRMLLRLRRPHEPSSRPPGRRSPGGVEAGRHSSGRSKRNGPPRVHKRASKRGQHSGSQSCNETILGILHISIRGTSPRRDDAGLRLRARP